jgi:hypothetical protein
MHLSTSHYREVVGGPGAGAVGDVEARRLVAVLLRCIEDECRTCADIAADAVALRGNACAMLHRMGQITRADPWHSASSAEGREIEQRLWSTPFVLRRQMVDIAADYIVKHWPARAKAGRFRGPEA